MSKGTIIVNYAGGDIIKFDFDEAEIDQDRDITKKRDQDGNVIELVPGGQTRITIKASLGKAADE